MLSIYNNNTSYYQLLSIIDSTMITIDNTVIQLGNFTNTPQLNHEIVYLTNTAYANLLSTTKEYSIIELDKIIDN